MIFLKLLRLLYISGTIIVFLSIIYWFVLFGSTAISIKGPLIGPLILFEAYVCFIFLCYLISGIIIILVIKNAKKNKKPLILGDKISLCCVPGAISFGLYKTFKNVNEGSYTTPFKTVDECFIYGNYIQLYTKIFLNYSHI